MSTPRPYQLSIAPALERFRPELEYACDFLDRCYHLRRRPGAATVLHYGPDGPPSAVLVPAALFPAAVRLDANGIHPDRGALAMAESGCGPAPLLPVARPGGPDYTNLGYDALGLIFLSLSRLEERDWPEPDRYGRFPYRHSLAARLDCYADPLADRAAHDLAAAVTGRGDPSPATESEIWLTHDVDRLRGYHRRREPAREMLGDLLKRRRPGAARRRLRDGYLSGEPWVSVRGLMDLSERYGHRSRFYFMGPSRNPMDSPYAATMAGLLRAVTDEITGRGHVVGFHPGVATATDGVEWERQRAGLERVIGRTVSEGRQHVLCYDAAVTPEIWDENHMAADHSLAFPEATGFRPNTCRAFAAYSLGRRRPLDLVQRATAIMDFGLFGGKYQSLSVAEALAESETAAACRRYGGTLVVLFYTGPGLRNWGEFYRALLERL